MKTPVFPLRRLIRILGLLCLALFVVFLTRLDLSRVRILLGGMQWRHWALLMLARVIHWGVRSLNWFLVLRSLGAGGSPVRLFGARVAGHAVGYLTPSAKWGGEAVRVLMLEDRDRKKVLASAVVDKTVEFLATFCLVAAAVLTLILKFALSGAQRLAVLGSVLISAAALFVLFRKQKKGLFIWILDGMRRFRLRFGFLENKRSQIEETDVYISDFYRRRPKLFAGIWLLYLGLALFWALEIDLTFSFTGAGEVGFLRSFLLVMLGSLSYLVPALPASLGFYELTYVSLFAILGIGMEQGTALILVRRILGLVWAGIGLVPLLGRPGRSRLQV